MRVSLAALSLVFLHAQTTQGLISGRVTDSDGNPITKAEVSAESLATSARATGRTNSEGLFALPLLPPGKYRVRVDAQGYQRQEIHELELEVAAFLELPFRLRLIQDVWEARQYQSLVLPGRGNVLSFYGPDLDLSRTVNLEAPRAASGGLESTVSEVINPIQIQDLPLSGRDVYTALVLQPGVAADTATARGIGISVNGQRASSSHFLLDGLENNNQLITGPLAVVASEAVQEFRISTNNFSAEYGWTTGYLANAVTRAGTDQWHGLGYFDLQNEVLDANDFARNAASLARNPFKEYQPGLQVGGPLLRNRLYQSASVEVLRSRGRDQPVSFYLPTTEYISTQLDNLPQNSQARKLLTQFAPPPVHAQPGQGDPNLALLTVAPPIDLNRTVALERIDYLTPKGAHRMMGRVAVTRLSRPNFIWSPYPEFSSPLGQNATGLGISVLSRISPALTHEIRGGISADLLEFKRAHPNIPAIAVDGPGAPVILPGSLAAYSYRNRSRNFELSDDLVWARGRHIFKLGGGFLLRTVDGYLTFAQSGEYLFGPFALFTADFPLAAYAGISRQAFLQSGAAVSPNFDREYHLNQFHAFVQDSFRVTPRLTINYGLRFERAGVPVNTGSIKDALVALGPGSSLSESLKRATVKYSSGGDEPLYSARRDAWGGRFGVSYSPFSNGNTVVRGALGIFYDRPFDNLWQNIRNNNVGLGVFNPDDQVAYLDPINRVLGAMPLAGIDDNSSRLTLYQPQIRSPRASIYFAGVRRQIGNLSFEVNTFGALGRGLITTDIVNRSYSVPGNSLPFASRFQPALQQIYYRANQGDSDYAALALIARYRGRRSQFQVSYTWSHSIDNQSEPLFGDYFDLSFTKASSAPTVRSTFVRQFDSAADHGNSDFDQRHNLVFYTLWESPSSWRSRLRRALLRDWKVGAIGAIRSGLPFTVVGVPVDGTSLISNRANLIGLAAADLPAPGGRIVLSRAAFASAGIVLGNTGRNAFSGPGFFSTDISLSRGFRLLWLGEAGRFTLRADAYNVLNHANLGNPDARLGSSTFGLATYGRQETSSGFPALAPLRETARQVQVLLRIEF